jgi:hypothetical protein
LKCTACGGALEVGFIPDTGTAQTWVAVWVGGTPSSKKGFWERLRSGGGVSMEGADVKAIEARRCTACGHLDLFATKPPEPGSSLAR